MSAWQVEDTSEGLRLVYVISRDLGDNATTWIDLLRLRLQVLQVYVLYFPSRFDLPVDSAAKQALQSFGRQTGPGTLVNFWDAADPEFSRALAFFEVKAPPALVLARGLVVKGRRRLVDPSDVYAIAVTDAETLGDRERLASAVNSAHEILVRGDAKEISAYLRQRSALSLLSLVGQLAGSLRDQIVKCKPKFMLPGGVGLQVG